jgi:NitT/TauT family transport system substrate-binding protein
LPVVIIGNGVLWDSKKPFTRTLVASDSTIRAAADVAGKLFATAGLNDLATLGVYAWVDKNGGDIKSMKWIEMPNSAQAAALFEHRIDGCTMNEPAVTAALATGKARVLCDGFASIADKFPIGVYITHQDYAATHLATIRKWLRVTYDATRYTNAHKSETTAMMSEITKIPPGVFRTIVRVDDGTDSNPAMLQPVIDAAAKFNFLPRAFPAREAYLANLGV